MWVNCYVFFCRSASLDVEPLYTFRCHTGPVLCLAMSATGEQCYSGGLDGAIHCWNLPCANIDPYDSFGMWAVLCQKKKLCSFDIVQHFFFPLSSNEMTSNQAGSASLQ